MPKWKRDYFTACNKVILAETLSPTFVGLQFRQVRSCAALRTTSSLPSVQFQVAEICYTQLNLLLLAIEARKYEGGEIYINPKDKVINPNAIGKRVILTLCIHFYSILFCWIHKIFVRYSYVQI